MDVEDAITYVCPVELTLRAIAGKWKPAILWELSAGQKRFNELQAALPGIAHKVLSQQLAQLHRDAMVVRCDDDAAGYTLTALGGTLRPALNALAQWGKEHGAAVSDRNHGRRNDTHSIATPLQTKSS